MNCMVNIQNSVIVNSVIFRHIVAQKEDCVTPAYWKPCHIQNSGIFRTQDIFRTLSRHILEYTERVTLAYWESYHIQNFTIFRNLAYLGPQAYSESCLFRLIQAYSGMLNNDSWNNINTLFFTLILYAFRRTLKGHMFLTTLASISMFDWVYLSNTRPLKIVLE